MLSLHGGPGEGRRQLFAPFPQGWTSLRTHVATGGCRELSASVAWSYVRYALAGGRAAECWHTVGGVPPRRRGYSAGG